MDNAIVASFFDKFIPEPNSGCWLWTASLKGRGYGQLNRRGVNLSAHRVSWEVHNGPIPGDFQVLHKCDTKSCVNPDHLYLGTHEDNMRDMANSGVMKGEGNASAILSERDVLKIRERRKQGRRLQEIADEYGVSYRTVQEICRGNLWSWLDG